MVRCARLSILLFLVFVRAFFFYGRRADGWAGARAYMSVPLTDSLPHSLDDDDDDDDDHHHHRTNLPKVVVVNINLFKLIELAHVHLVSEEASDSPKAFAKLRPLLRFVGDKLQRAAKLFVFVGKPLEQRHLLLNFEIDSCAEATGTRGIAVDDIYIEREISKRESHASRQLGHLFPCRQSASSPRPLQTSGS